MESVCTGLVLKVSSYKENDKLAKIYTIEKGLITAVFKGVKKSGAKMKFFAQPFSFCNFELVEGGFNTIKNAVAIEELTSVCKDFDKFTCACLIAEAVCNTALAEPNERLFFLLLKSLKEIIYSKKSPYLMASYFLVKYLLISGYSKLPLMPTDTSTPNKLIAFLLNNEEDFNIEVEESLVKSALIVAINGFERNFDVELISKTSVL